MQNWKQALWLAKFELKVSIVNILLSLLFFLFIGWSLSSLYSDYLDKGFVLIDLLFLIMFTLGSVWTKPKNLQAQRMNDDLLAQPTFMMQHQLAIPKDILIKSRFIIYTVYSFPSQILLLLVSYMSAPDLREAMTPGQFIAFSVIWLSFGIYMGNMAAADAGTRATRMKSVFYVIALTAGMILFLTAFNLFSNYGMVHWTIIFAQKWPFISAAISVVLAVLGFKYAQQHMNKLINKLDYL
jgi:hypothetical protein